MSRAAVYLHERGFDPEGPRFLVVKGETVREYRYSGTAWKNWDAIDDWIHAWPDLLRAEPKDHHERTIPASLPDFEVVCPECKGTKRVWVECNWGPDELEACYICPRCGGSGVVLQVAHAEPRYEHTINCWRKAFGSKPQPCDCDHDRTTPIVAVSDLRVLPVVEGDPEQDLAEVVKDWTECIIVNGSTGLTMRFSDYGDGTFDLDDITDEPCAADLAPGDTVLALGEPRLLDEPIVAMLCDPYERPDANTVCPDCNGFGRVPLALLPGLQSVEGVEIR